MNSKVVMLVSFLVLAKISPVLGSPVSASDCNEGVYSYYQPLTLGAIKAYQIFISPSKGSNCPMYPSCSAYGYQAFSKYNVLKAYAVTADRLHRCGHDLANYRTIEVSEEVRYEDRLQVAKTDAGNTSIETDNTSILNAGEKPANIYINNEERIRGFAVFLRNNNRYSETVNEYQRLIVYYPETKYLNEAIRAIVSCLNEMEKYLEIVHFGQYMLNTNIDTSLQSEIRFAMGGAYYKLGNYRIARDYYNKLGTDSMFSDKSLLLSGVSYIKQWDFKSAENEFMKIQHNSEYYTVSQEFINYSREGDFVNFKNPTTAGFLSIIPGLGYLYDGYKQTAISSFLVNSLFIYGMLEAYKSDNKGLSAIMSILSFGWYSGNIYGSVVSAKRKNEKIKNDYITKFVIQFEY